MHHLRGRVASILIGLAAAILIVGVAILPFLTPQWVAFEQGRAEAAVWTGFTTGQLRTATDSILADLVFGGTFDVAIAGQPVLNDRERAHMTDVRSVFRSLWVLAAVSAVVLAAAAGRSDRTRLWQRIRRGSLALTVGVVIVGSVALVAFDQLFEVFHQVFFPAGTYLFDPATDRLVQLFPFRFWDETATIAGVVILAIALGVAALAGRRPVGTNASQSAAERSVIVEPGS